MKKLFVAYFCISTVMWISASDEFDFKKKATTFAKGFGIGLSTGFAAALVDIKISDRHYQNPLYANRRRVIIPGSSFLIEPIGRWVAIKKSNMTPREKNIFGWAAWSASWCAFVVSSHFYVKYKNHNWH